MNALKNNEKQRGIKSMPSRDQVYAMLMLRNREENLFSTLPMELIQEIGDFHEGPNSDIAKALQYAAYARKEDVRELINMLEDNPRLLLETGNVKTPGGDEIRRVTIYEFALGAGDYELAEIVQGYFSRINDGEKQMMRQYERYKPHIESMLDQKPYDLSPLFELIKKATLQEVTALLNKNMTGDNELCKALVKFRKDWAPRVLTKPGMHYNYASLQHAFELLDREWDNLYESSGNDYDKIRLVWRQLIGFEMRRLPGIDRCVTAQSVLTIMDQNENVIRSYKFKNNEGDFPITDSDNSLDGLGGDFGVEVIGCSEPSGHGSPKAHAEGVKKFCETKKSNLKNVYSSVDQLITQPSLVF
ncbi:TPA: hypothetical protein ACT9K7_003239 [Legionella pneumophila]|uniref:hypothetical protein n=1 Tax=Legionella pneumophila TaxID=446 RepID=UPI001A2FE8E8|nr:hypothetical protein [Legionella pneumophila]